MLVVLFIAGGAVCLIIYLLNTRIGLLLWIVLESIFLWIFQLIDRGASPLMLLLVACDQAVFLPNLQKVEAKFGLQHKF